jgi:myo-inositol-1-phosphate synthase
MNDGFPALNSRFLLPDSARRGLDQIMGSIRIALAGVGNCASALVQGLHYYQTRATEACTGLMHWDVGGYKPFDIEVAAAFDIDQRKVGEDLSRSIFAPPNCATRFVESVPETGLPVSMGRVLDGFPESMKVSDPDQSFVLAITLASYYSWR